MKKLNLHHFAVLPLLTLMATSPMVLEKSLPSRGIASEIIVKEVKSEHPRYDEIAGKINRDSLLKDEAASEEKIIKKITALKEEIKCLQEVTNEPDRKEKIEAAIIDSVLIDESIKALKLDDKDLKLAILDIEKLLEPTTEVNPEGDIQVVADEPKKEEPKKEDDKKVEVACEHEEKNILLTKQVEQLMTDQQKVMETILGMAQMMVSMFQQQQQLQMPNPYYANGPGFYAQSPYQYQQPFTAGNWVYHPSGFQPNQGNIFGQNPQAPQAPAPQVAPLHEGFYPDQTVQQPASNWNLRPEMSFQQNPIATTFGLDPMSFNFQNTI